MTAEEQAIIAAAIAFEQTYTVAHEKRCQPDRAALAAAASRLVKAVRAHKDPEAEAPGS